ncbi:hypothetical protein ACYOEI_30385, partial [Singulisphaera rosea]
PAEVKPVLVASASSAPASLAPAPAPVRQDAQGDRKRMREMLANSGSRVVFFVTDVIGGHASDQVNSLVKEMPRLDSSYGRITVGQGIVIDPSRPDEATVYALVMNDREVERFRDKLQGAFPKSLKEAGASSDVVARLSDVGQIAYFDGQSAADLVPVPRESTTHVVTKSASKAQRAEKVAYAPEFDGITVVEVHEAEGSSSTQEEPTPQQLRSGSHPSNRNLKDSDPPAIVADRASSTKGAGPADPAKGGTRRPQSSSVVLVWVSTPKGAGTRVR